MVISEKEKKRRQHEKELISLKNKMGKNIVWFNSLPISKQYDILFEWKKEKYCNKLKSPETKKVRERLPFKRKWITVLRKIFPPSIKHLINNKKMSRHFNPSIESLRDTTINILLNEK